MGKLDSISINDKRKSELGGIRRGDEHICITHLPGLKKPCLCIRNGCVIRKIASFDSEEYAEGFYKMLCKWLMIEEELKSENRD